MDGSASKIISPKRVAVLIKMNSTATQIMTAYRDCGLRRDKPDMKGSPGAILALLWARAP